MIFRLDSAEAIGAVDDILTGVGLRHGSRQTRVGAWQGGERQRSPKISVTPETASRAGGPGVVSVPEWAGLSWLRAGFSTREGGRTAVYGERGEQNLGWTKEDKPEVVAGNRKRFLRAVQRNLNGAETKWPLLLVRQFHSGMIRVVKNAAEAESLVTADGKPVLRGDAVISAAPGVMLGVVTADCVPVLLADKRTHAVAAFHAGWRGTLGRIVERGVGSMRLQLGSRPEDLVAAIGPGIGACCFAVGEEVKFDFESQFGYAKELFSEVYDSDPVREKYPLLFLTARAPGHSNIGPQIHLDLIEANRRQLLDAGLPESAISVVGECTACTRLSGGRRKYFSHRAEQGFTGRMLSVIGAVGHPAS